MKLFLSWAGGFIAFIVLCLIVFGLTSGFEFLGIQKDSILNPMREDVRRDVFENTNSYNRGVAVDLARYRFEYQLTKDPVERSALRSAIALKFSDYDASKLQEPALRNFLVEIRGY